MHETSREEAKKKVRGGACLSVFAKPRKKFGGETPTDAIGDLPCRRTRPRLKREAHDCRRSTTALAQGTLVAKGSASGQASWDAARALDPMRSPQPGGEDLAQLFTGVTRPHLSQSSDCTSRAGHSAGRLMPDAARGAGCKAARGHRTRPAIRDCLPDRVRSLGEIRPQACVTITVT
jgi:hypothetical protein